MSDATGAHEVGIRIAASLREHGVEYAIGGALALNLWGPARGTRDVDINLFVTEDRLGQAFDALRAAGVGFDPTEARRRAGREGMFVGRASGMRVDVFVPSIDYSWEAASTRVTVDTPAGPIDFLSAEALSVFKLLFYRPKDLVDLSHLVALMREELDHALVRDRIVAMMGEDDERTRAWDRIVSEQLSLDA